MENQTDCTVKAVRSDNAREYVSDSLLNFYSSKGIQPQNSIPYTPEQNGKAERLNRTLLTKATSMLQQSGLPLNHWSDAVQAAAHLRNRLPVAGKAGTPFELYNGYKPDISYLRPFGCKAYITLPKQHRTHKFTPQFYASLQFKGSASRSKAVQVCSVHTYTGHVGVLQCTPGLSCILALLVPVTTSDPTLWLL
jgi:hypothetical protein